MRIAWHLQPYDSYEAPTYITGRLRVCSLASEISKPFSILAFKTWACECHLRDTGSSSSNQRNCAMHHHPSLFECPACPICPSNLKGSSLCLKYVVSSELLKSMNFPLFDSIIFPLQVASDSDAWKRASPHNRLIIFRIHFLELYNIINVKR